MIRSHKVTHMEFLKQVMLLENGYMVRVVCVYINRQTTCLRS